MILDKSGMSEEEFNKLLLDFSKYVKVVTTEQTIDYRQQAKEVMDSIDSDDSIFIATALALNCPIWSDDRHFQQQNKIKIFTTKEIIELTNSI